MVVRFQTTNMAQVERGYKYCSLTLIEVISLAKERDLDPNTRDEAVIMLLNQDNIDLKGGKKLKETFPRKTVVYKLNNNLEKKMSDEAKKEVKSRRKAYKSEKTEELFNKMVVMYPDALTKQNDPRYSLARSKKLMDKDTMAVMGVKFEHPGVYYVFYATERAPELPELPEKGKESKESKVVSEEIFLRFMQRKGLQEDDGKCVGTLDKCFKTFKHWAKDCGLPQIDKLLRERRVAAKKAIETADKVKTAKTAETAGAAKSKDPDKPEKIKK